MPTRGDPSVRRRRILKATGGLAGAGLVSGLAGCTESEGGPNPADGGGDGGGGDGGTESATEETEEFDLEGTPVPPNELDPVSFEGSGNDETDPVSLAGYMVVVEAEHAGEGDFVVTLRDSNGEHDDRSIVDRTGATGIVWGEGVPAGEWVLDVTADGDWTISVRQPQIAPGDGEEIRFVKSGDERGAVFPVDLTELVFIRGKHEGDGEFLVESYTISGERHDGTEVISESGEGRPQITLDFRGTSWFSVTATGPWELRFTKI